MLKKNTEQKNIEETDVVVNSHRNTFGNLVRRDIGSYVFLLPVVLGFFIFTLYPVAMSFIYSLTDFNGIYYESFGFFNFIKMFDPSSSGLFFEIFGSFLVTFEWALISIPLGMVLSFALSLAVVKEVKGVSVFRLLYYMPTIIPSIVISLVWADVFRFDGIANQFLAILGLPANTWLTSSDTALGTLILSGVWGIGGNMIMWLAALRNVPVELYEAASLDGSNYIKSLFKITIPMCSPIIFFNLINAMIAAFQAFDIYAMVDSTQRSFLYFISFRIYDTAFGGGNQYGLACAIGWLLFLVIAILTMFTFKTSGWVNYGDEV